MLILWNRNFLLFCYLSTKSFEYANLMFAVSLFNVTLSVAQPKGVTVVSPKPPKPGFELRAAKPVELYKLDKIHKVSFWLTVF